MVGPHGRPVSNALGVVPHPVGVDNATSSVGYHGKHATVRGSRHTTHHAVRRAAQGSRPLAPDESVITAYATRRDNDRGRSQLEVTDHLTAARHSPSGI